MRGSPEIGIPARGALDAAIARMLWDLSERLTGIGWPMSTAIAV